MVQLDLTGFSVGSCLVLHGSSSDLFRFRVRVNSINPESTRVNSVWFWSMAVNSKTW
ncbi:hypothetical protein HanIR_Chr11g0531071 [Helianthus annuus]|nr:hypothetical protein HanIR_Chr11g0531071 [Helianthus annuus]